MCTSLTKSWPVTRSTQSSGQRHAIVLPKVSSKAFLVPNSASAVVLSVIQLYARFWKYDPLLRNRLVLMRRNVGNHPLHVCAHERAAFHSAVLIYVLYFIMEVPRTSRFRMLATEGYEAS